ncbi:MAG: EthD domain-containing protein [Deltaproteobacteria bacterium]|nr:EthD domain-containing protein [Deltaproteobacteria bacterium]
MIKMIFALRRLPHLSREEFQKYWREKHGPLAQKNLPILRCKRYIQNHTLQTDFDELLQMTRGFTVEPFDGIVELWWDSIQDIEEAYGSPEGAEAQNELLEDERKFIDLERSPMWFTEEIGFI